MYFTHVSEPKSNFLTTSVSWSPNGNIRGTITSSTDEFPSFSVPSVQSFMSDSRLMLISGSPFSFNVIVNDRYFPCSNFISPEYCALYDFPAAVILKTGVEAAMVCAGIMARYFNGVANASIVILALLVPVVMLCVLRSIVASVAISSISTVAPSVTPKSTSSTSTNDNAWL